MNRQQIILAGLVAAALLIAAALGYSHLQSRRAEAGRALTELSETRQMVEQIRQYRQGPNLAAEQERLESETTGLIESAARSAGIPGDSLQRISTDAQARQLGDTAYKEKTTLVMLRRVTLRQIVDMMVQLAAGESGLQVKSIRLSAPRDEKSDEQWSAELVLAYLIYEAPEAAR